MSTKRTKAVLKYVKRHSIIFVILYCCIIITSFLSTIYPWMFGNLIDEVFYDGNISNFIKIVIAYTATFLIGQVFHFILNMSWARLMTRFLFDIRKDFLIESYQAREKHYHQFILVI